MTEAPKPDDANQEESTFSRQVGNQSRRMLKARRDGTTSVWFGLGMSGLIGWTVVVPTLIGAAIGLWIDERQPSTCSWTLMLLLTGLIVGCLNAWRWIDRQCNQIQDDQNG